MTVGYDCSRHTLKNLLTSGISRNKFIISKYLVFIVMTLMQFVYFYGTAFIVASIKNGIGILDLGFIQELSKTIGIQFACIQGVFVIALFVLVLTFSNVMSVFTVIVVPVTLTVLSLFLDKIKWLKYLAFQNNMDMAWRDSMPETYWSYVFLATALVFLVFFIASLIVFKKKDL
jgi:ABC-2 type transport system permease protein